MDGPHPPAVMLENPLKWGRAVDVANQPDGCRIEVGGNRHTLLLGRVDDRLDREIVMERLAASPVNVSHGGANLRVAVTIDDLFQKIDQTTIALQDRQNVQLDQQELSSKVVRPWPRNRGR